MRVDMKNAFAQSLANLKVQKIFQKRNKKENKTVTCMMELQEFRKPM